MRIVRDNPGDYVNNTAEESAGRTTARLTSSSKLLADLDDEGKLKINAALYDPKTGIAAYLD